MTPLPLMFEATPRRSLPRSARILRAAIAALAADRGLLDAIREPQGLAHPISQRARRLMRAGRLGGW